MLLTILIPTCLLFILTGLFAIKESDELQMVGAIIILLAIFGGGLVVYRYYSSAIKVQIINRETGTNYTVNEYLFAGDEIKEVRELNRRTTEVNGDLSRERVECKQ